MFDVFDNPDERTTPPGRTAPVLPTIDEKAPAIVKSGTGVIVARFQVDDLHPKHRKLIEAVRERSTRTLILLGVAPTLGTAENPLDYETRAHMVYEAYPDVVVLPLADIGDDDRWSQAVDSAIKVIAPIGRVTLYGGRDSFIKHYVGRYQTQELGEEVFGPDDGTSGTACRIQVAEQGPLRTREGRQGAIYTAQRQFPKVYPTVDVAVLSRFETARTRAVGPEGGELHVLLGKKPGETEWRFPGGFTDPTDICFEEAAARELREETGITLRPKGPNYEPALAYVGSMRIDDPRYTGRDRICTTLFAVQLPPDRVKEAKAGDDLAAVDWRPLDTKLLNEVAPLHRPLVLLLLERLKATDAS
jgi:bifunctional NMN adenylyltransferase/nudix hydrolase